MQHNLIKYRIACLQMICKHFGEEYSIRALYRICFATNEGISMLDISEAAKTFGLQATCAKCSIKELNSTYLPWILH